jgi:hypothetical protein
MANAVIGRGRDPGGEYVLAKSAGTGGRKREITFIIAGPWSLREAGLGRMRTERGVRPGRNNKTERFSSRRRGLQRDEGSQPLYYTPHWIYEKPHGERSKRNSG